MDEAYGSYAADDECFDNHDYDDDTDDDNDHKNDSYTAAGAAPGANVSCSGFWLPVRLPDSGQTPSKKVSVPEIMFHLKLPNNKD